MACHCEDPKLTCEPIRLKPVTGFFSETSENNPSYLPQRSDFIAKSVKPPDENAMGPVGPWATGRPIWNPSTDIVGIRPVVDRYSITKYCPIDWRKGNLAVFDMVKDTDGLNKSVKCILDAIASKSDRNQNDNSLRIQKRLQEIRSYQCQIEGLVMDLREEIVLLTEAKVRMKFVLPVLKMPESITGECIDKRTCRSAPDLVKDEVDDELIKEMATIYEVKNMFQQQIEKVEREIAANKACKDELEKDWSDKKETVELETVNACLRNNSPNIWFKPGSTRVQNSQSSVDSWQYYAETLIKLGTTQVQKSRELRASLDSGFLFEALKNLRNQADKVTSLLQKRIEETDLCKQGFELELQKVLAQIAETESHYDSLDRLLRQLDYTLKVAQTRLDNRMQRRRTENCRDEPQYGLIDEVKSINESQTQLRQQVREVDEILSKLYQTRANLEFQILTKRKSLYIDHERCMAYRELFPDANTLMGPTV